MGEPLDPACQVYFHQRLVADRKRMVDALETVIGSVDPDELAAQIERLAPADVLVALSREGIPPAFMFPTPLIIASEPVLLGYYRSLLGISKKSFYDDALRGRFRSSETDGTFTKHHAENVDALCEVMSAALADLVRQVPTLTLRDLLSLPLLTMGAQYEGAWRVLIGQKAEAEVFAAIYAAVQHRATKQTAKLITLTDEIGRKIRIVRSSDPDVAIERELAEGASWELLLAIEVKGGKDRSNAHNRAGEADKSHSKTESALHWTIAMTARLDAQKIASESSRTDEWFDVDEIRAQSGPDWQRLRVDLAKVIGI